MLTKGDAFFKAHPDKVLGEMHISFQNRMIVSGNKDTIISYFKSGKEELKSLQPENSKNVYIARVKLLQKILTKGDDPILKARLKLLKKHVGN